MKVVFDTNVYISEALFNGLAELVIKAGRGQAFSIYVSHFILAEIETVLVNHFQTTRRFAKLTAQRARKCARLVATRQRRYDEVIDRNDHPILETAVNAGADYLVTGDKHLLVISPYQGISILKVADFHRSLRDLGIR